MSSQKRTKVQDAKGARREYARRTDREAMLDARMGMVFAAVDWYPIELVRALVFKSRASLDRRNVRAPEPMPPWVRAGLAFLEILRSRHPEAFEALCDACPRLRSALDSELRFAFDVLVPEGAILPVGAETIDLSWAAKIGACLDEAFASRKPRTSECDSFYMGCRLWFRIARLGTPTPSLVGLLAVSIGLDSAEDGLNAVTDCWEKRIRRARARGGFEQVDVVADACRNAIGEHWDAGRAYEFLARAS